MSNPAFLFKAVCILLAGINFLVFWFTIGQLATILEYGNADWFGKFVGLTSLVLWSLVIWGGRMIPYTALAE